MRREKMNNKGFSLVELIIVIAIMAILSAALAPQLMKYIEKSRVSTDQSSCAAIESCVNAALAEEAVYKEVAASGSNGASAAGVSNIVMNITVDESRDLAAGDFDVTVGQDCPQLVAELVTTLGKLKAPKQTGMNVYVVESETTRSTTTGTMASDTVEVGRIKVHTKSAAQTATTFN